MTIKRPSLGERGVAALPLTRTTGAPTDAPQATPTQRAAAEVLTMPLRAQAGYVHLVEAAIAELRADPQAGGNPVVRQRLAALEAVIGQVRALNEEAMATRVMATLPAEAAHGAAGGRDGRGPR